MKATHDGKVIRCGVDRVHCLEYSGGYCREYQELGYRYRALSAGVGVCFYFFFRLEYVLRLYCSPQPRKYALSFFGIVDLLATLPLYIGWLFGTARYLLVIRTFRLIRVFRIFKLFNYLNEGNFLLRSLVFSSRKIIVFFLFVLILVTSIGTLMYMIEGQRPGTSFNNIPNSIYWAIVTMTTVGYGDITPETPLGRFLSAIVMLLGYTIIAVPQELFLRL